MTPAEVETGRYSEATIDALIEVHQAMEHDPLFYSETLAAQNPEMMDLVEWTDMSGGDWLAFSLLLRHAITGAVNRLLGSTSHWLPFTREGPYCLF